MMMSMKEIIIKKGGHAIIKMPYDKSIMDDYESNLQAAKNNSISFHVIGSAGNIQRGSVLAIIKEVGTSFKKSNGEDVFWFLAKVVDCNVDNFSQDMKFWFKINKETLSTWGFQEKEQIKHLEGKNVSIRLPSSPKEKISTDKIIFFVFKYQSINLV
jgi:hypothetical protein